MNLRMHVEGGSAGKWLVVITSTRSLKAALKNTTVSGEAGMEVVGRLWEP